jgi:anti-sigma regulatory factor (Ser/Thr protein kinase)
MDEIVLTLPREKPFYGVAHLVLGGLAARLDVTYEHLEDLQLALDTLLESERDDGEVTLKLRLDESTIVAEVGPFHGAVRNELERDAGNSMGLRRILDTVVDRVELGEREGSAWVTLTKTIHAEQA